MAEKKPAFNEEQYNMLTHSNPDIPKQQVFNMFMDNAHECLNAMEKACTNEDYTLWLTAADELGNLAKIIGAEGFSELVSSMQDAANSRQTELHKALSDIRAELEKLRTTLRNV